jgi:hypothetical protein
MRLKQNSSTAIVVKKSWANLQAIQCFLRDRPQNGNGKSITHSPGNGDAHASSSAQSGDDSCTIFARVLDDTDVRGLWIELNTREHEKDPAVELQALMIPWPAVLAMVVGNHFASTTKEAEEHELVDHR